MLSYGSARYIPIEVTQSDIDAGVPGDRCLCPVALAIKRSMNVKASVMPLYAVFFYDDKQWDYVPVPMSVSIFVAKFDNLEKVEPFFVYFDRERQRLVSFNEVGIQEDGVSNDWDINSIPLSDRVNAKISAYIDSIVLDEAYKLEK